MRMEDCVFCKIVKGEVPCHKVYEDDSVLAFLDIYPKAKGHILVIPKKHFENIHEIEDGSLRDVISVVKKMSFLVKEKLGVKSVNVLNASGKEAQQSVFHIHFHVLPRVEDDALDVFHLKEDFEKPDLDELKRVLTS